MFDLALSLDDVISFAVGEPGFEADDHIVAAGQKALATPAMHYTHVDGIPELRAAIARYSAREKGLEYDPDTEIQVTHGATAGLYLSFLALIDPGDEVILGSPFFTAYEAQVLAVDGKPVVVPLCPENAFHHNAADIEAAITPRTKAIVLNSPGNPTGAVTSPDELADIARVAVEHDLWVITDEVYHRFVYDDAKQVSIAAFPGMHERTVVIDSLSKTYAMTGWRIGYLLGPADFVTETSAISEVVTSSNNSASQLAAVAALDGGQDKLFAMERAYDENRRLVIEALADAPGLRLANPEGAFYAFVDIRGTGMSSHDFAMQLLSEERVAVVPGDAFGLAGEGFIRISYVGTIADTREGIERVCRFAARRAQRVAPVAP